MKSHALGLGRSNGGILSYENGAYEETNTPGPGLGEGERGVDLPLGLGRHVNTNTGWGANILLTTMYHVYYEGAVERFTGSLLMIITTSRVLTVTEEVTCPRGADKGRESL